MLNLLRVPPLAQTRRLPLRSPCFSKQKAVPRWNTLTGPPYGWPACQAFCIFKPNPQHKSKKEPSDKLQSLRTAAQGF